MDENDYTKDYSKAHSKVNDFSEEENIYFSPKPRVKKSRKQEPVIVDDIEILKKMEKLKRMNPSLKFDESKEGGEVIKIATININRNNYYK